MMGLFFDYVFQTLMYQPTGNDMIDEFIFWSSFFLELAAAVGVVIMVLKNESLRKRRRPIDRLVFGACVLVLSQNVLDMSLVPLVEIEAPWEPPVFYILLVVNEMLYLAIILQWLICVDFSLHHSLDHIRRRYRHAALPIIIVGVLETIRIFVYIRMPDTGILPDAVANMLHSLYIIVEICYILTAVMLVKRYETDRREPRFLRLGAFIIPFVIGVLVRYYDAALLGFGIIFTYAAMSRRDKYIDFKTGLYNSGFLDCIGEHWDKKGYEDASAMLSSAPGHEGEMAGILSEIRIPDCYIIKLGEGCFVLLSPEVRRSALKMAEDLLKGAAKEADPPFTVVTRAMNRTKGQTMKEFAAEIRRAAFVPDHPREGGNGSC